MSNIKARMTCGIAVIVAGFVLAVPAFAQNASQDVMKQCGEKWQAAKTANTTGDQTWPQFLSKCRTDSAQKPAATPASATTAVPAVAAPGAKPAAPAVAQVPGAKPAAPAAATPAVTVPPATGKPPVPSAAAPAATAKPAVTNAVFPSRIDPKYASEKPGQQRQKTCVDQYNANKATNNGAGNGGLNWIQKGGGYWSECNKRLGGGTST